MIVAAAAATQLAREAAAACPAGARVVIIGASRGAADDFARDIAAAAPATFGLERLTLVQLAARTAMVELARAGRTLATPLAAAAAAAQAVFEALGAGSLDYFAPVAATPGFPRAVASTLEELRLTSVPGRALAAAPRSGRDLADLLDRFEAAFDNSATADRAALLHSAAQQLRAVTMQPGTGA